MQIFLHQLDGSQTILEITENTDLNTLIASNNLANCRLIHQGENINTTAQLLTLNNNANLFVTADLDGGKKKKKKKVYTTKKKNKHIHKKSPGATLALYTVDGNCFTNSGKGNVTQTRKTCPSCGPGIFMAQHWDRYYCGTCHTTIKMDAETIKKNE
jgi:small subunit ribosomal protein S27Ae